MKHGTWDKLPLSLCLASVTATLAVTGCGLTGTMPDTATTFTVRIENVSDGETLALPDDSTQGVPLSPGVWVVHVSGTPLFQDGEADLGEGLKALAEDGDPAPNIFAPYADVLRAKEGVLFAGAFDVPAGAVAPAPLASGQAYEFAVAIEDRSARLSFATMFVPSNDLFYAPRGEGIALFAESGQPRSGDVTAEIMLWDAGTEVNQTPGVGPDQPQRQESADTGAEEEGGVVRQVDDGFVYPVTAAVIRVTLTVPPDPIVVGLSGILTQIFQAYATDLVTGTLNLTG